MDMGLGGLQELVMDREAWCAAVHGVAKSRTRLNDKTELNLKPFLLDPCLIPRVVEFGRIFRSQPSNCSELPLLPPISLNQSLI